MKTTKTILVGIAAGIVASWLKSVVEPPLQKGGLHFFPATENELELKGADITGHPANMPPAVLSKNIYHEVTGKDLNDKTAEKTMPYYHYALGLLLAVTYVFARKKNHVVRSGQGVSAGIAMFALTHGSVVPELGLQDKVRKMPKSWWVWEFGSHVLFGVFLEQSVKLFKKIF